MPEQQSDINAPCTQKGGAAGSCLCCMDALLWQRLLPLLGLLALICGGHLLCCFHLLLGVAVLHQPDDGHHRT